MKKIILTFVQLFWNYKITTLVHCWTILLFSWFFIACDTDECNCAGSCNSQSPTVREVANQEGRVAFHSEEDRWMIIAAEEGTFDTQYLGILCDSLPESFRRIGMNVVFSGEYKRYDKDSKGPIPGQTYYYLYLSQILQPNDD